jgi:DNA-binding NtrC family response regulator
LAVRVSISNGNVLIVEDDDTIRRLPIELLTHQKHVNVGAEAVEHFVRESGAPA